MQNIRIPEPTLTPGMMRALSPARLDALKEVANIGAGHAATALSLMTGARIVPGRSARASVAKCRPGSAGLSGRRAGSFANMRRKRC